MKKTLIILILVLAYKLTNAQVKVLGKIEPNGAKDKYPTHVDSLGRGGLMTTASWQERNAIPVERRKAGMLVRVKSVSVDSTYTLGVGLTNVDWMAFVAGADVTNKEDKLNKVASLASPDHTTYPTTQAVAVGLAARASLNGDNTFTGSNVIKNGGSLYVEGSTSIKGAVQIDGEEGVSVISSEYPLVKSSLTYGQLAMENPEGNFYAGNGQLSMNYNLFSPNSLKLDVASLNPNLSFNKNGKSITFYHTALNQTDDVIGVFMPRTNGTLALISDIPDVTAKANLVGGNTFSGTQNLDTLQVATGLASSPYYKIYGSKVGSGPNASSGLVISTTGGQTAGEVGTAPFSIRGGVVTASALYLKGNNPALGNVYKKTQVDDLVNTKANLAGDNTFTGNNKSVNTIDLLNPDDEVTKGFVSETKIVEGAEEIWTRYSTVNGNGLYFGLNSNTISNSLAWYYGSGVNYRNNGHMISVRPPTLTSDIVVNYPTSSGTLATTNSQDIGKMFTYTTSGNGILTTFIVPHGLSYTPTMALVTANSADAITGSSDGNHMSLTSSATISGSNIIITCINTVTDGSANASIAVPRSGTNNLTWTIMVK